LTHHSYAQNILLVDAESAVQGYPWKHLQQTDGWRICGSDKCCHLMVQVMEAWLIADKDALKNFYGQKFRKKAIPSRENVENSSFTVDSVWAQSHHK